MRVFQVSASPRTGQKKHPENARNHMINKVERVNGIEPSFEAWEAPVLPLNYTRDMVGDPGLYWGTQEGVTI